MLMIGGRSRLIGYPVYFQKKLLVGEYQTASRSLVAWLAFHKSLEYHVRSRWHSWNPSRLLKKSSSTRKSIISLCNLCGPLCLCGEIAPKTFTTEAQRPLRSHREDSPNAARNLFQQPALESLRYKWSPRRLPGA